MTTQQTNGAKVTRPAVSLIIACYNQADFLRKIFISLQRQSFIDFEIVIADDGSGTALAEVVADYRNQFKHPVQHAWHPDNGFQKTVIANEAVRLSRADYLIFIDGDCLLHHRFIERHFARGKRGIVLSGRRIPLTSELTEKLTDTDVQNGKFERIFFWWNHTEDKNRKRGLYLPFVYKLINRTQKNYWVWGSNFSMFKDDFISLNGYEENIIGRGYEDINLSERIKLKGLKIKKITYEALQYHLFHSSGPLPHSQESIDRIVHPTHFYAAKGINNPQVTVPNVQNNA